IVSFDEQRAILLKHQFDLNAALAQCENEKKAIFEKIAELDKQLNTIPKTSQSSETALSYRLMPTEQKILGLKVRELDLLSKYKEDNLLVTSVREQLRLTEAFMENQRKVKPAEVVDPLWNDVYKHRLSNQAELTALNARGDSLTEQLRAVGLEMQAFEALEQRNKSILRELADNEEKYRIYRQRVEEAKVFDELNRQKMTSVIVIERASASGIPANPMRPLYILIPLILAGGIAGSLAIAYMREFLSHGVRTPSDVEKRLGIPVLVTIPIKAN
ncbi:MAG: hypothetical protein AAGU11_19185, partial [Syntrophobacteraceae bacterium]